MSCAKNFVLGVLSDVVYVVQLHDSFRYRREERENIKICIFFDVKLRRWDVELVDRKTAPDFF